MTLIFVDVEAYGGAPAVGKMTEFGAVEFSTRETFHGLIWKSSPDPTNPAIPLPTERAAADPAEVFHQFDAWLKRFKAPYVFVSDNNGYDWQWVLEIPRQQSIWPFITSNCRLLRRIARRFLHTRKRLEATAPNGSRSQSCQRCDGKCRGIRANAQR
jgi:hypothetical protein